MPSRTYIIAEAGVNHDGQRDTAFELIDAAVEAGADAVKFQTFDAKRLASRTAPKAAYQKARTDATESQLAMLTKLELPLDWHAPLQAHARSSGVEFLSTAFDSVSLGFLDSLGMPMFKVPSGELTNGPLLWRFARTRKPLIVSTGMATLSEVEQGLAVIAHALLEPHEPRDMGEVWRTWSRPAARKELDDHVTLLHCTSQYPTPWSDVNLRAMDTLSSAFGLKVGYSDHTEGVLIPIAAVARGARIIEKHFTLDRTRPGPDHAASLEPHELKAMVASIRNLETAMGDGRKAPQPSEWDSRVAGRQQVTAVEDITEGSMIRREQLSTARCGSGLAPTELWGLVGRVAPRSVRSGEPVDFS